MKKLLTITLLILSNHAQAYMQCPVGVDPNGPNSSGVACYWVEPGSEDEGGQDGGYQGRAAVHYSPEEWKAFIDAAKESDIRNEKDRMKDPVYRKLKQGTWDFATQKPGSEVKLCQASFLTLSGGVMLMDFSGQQNSTLLGFFGMAIPKAKKMQKVKLSLTQSGSTQTVHAFHTPFPGDRSIGMYVFTVPSTQALLNSIEDRQDYTIEMDGQLMARGAWHDGLKAKKWLTDCVNKQKN